MTDFCHIAPTAYINQLCLAERTHHLVLAHLIEQDQAYRELYSNISGQLGSTVIMDNSAFEMFKQGRPMYPSEKLVEMGKQVHADYIVMTDYPAEPGIKTILKAEEMAPELRAAGFGTFFCPQSKVGDIEDLIDGFEWAADSPDVDYIGVSILSVPNAYAVEKNNKLQRYLSRYVFMGVLDELGILDKIVENGKKIHFLGMVDGPNEVELVRRYLPIINTWDSSAAVWAGLNGISFDQSPTGLINGKFEKEVDFSFVLPEDQNSNLDIALNNMEYIDGLIDTVVRDQIDRLHLDRGC